MTVRPEHFFISTPFIRWTLVPALVLFAVSMPLMMDRWTVGTLLLVGGLSLAALLYAGALLWPRHLRWAGRAVAGMVFVFYVFYAIYEWFFSAQPFRFIGPRSESSPRNALLGLIIIGVPALVYALRGGKHSTSLEPDDPGSDDA